MRQQEAMVFAPSWGLWVLVVGLLLVALPSVVNAQTGSFWFEGGKHESTYGDGRMREGASIGGGVSFAIGGRARRTTGVMVPVGFEIKGNWGSGLDAIGFVDLGIRFHSLSFGPGANYSFLQRSAAPDSRCLTGPLSPQTSCNAGGTRDIGGFASLGVSGYAKVIFGPQERAFAQVRYIYYPPSTTSLLSASELAQTFGIFAAAVTESPLAVQTSEPYHPDDFPEVRDADELRITAGYVFGGGETMAKVVRIQFVEKSFQLTPVLANSNGMFDQRTRQITLGVGFSF